MSALFAYLHHLAAFALVASLVVEFVLVKDGITCGNARIVQKADIAFGIAAGIILIVGALRVMYFEKGLAYYTHNIAFHAKLGTFLIVGLLSIVPTFEFLKWRKQTRVGAAPEISPKKLKTVRVLIHLELLGVAIIILCAALMARGIGELQ